MKKVTHHFSFDIYDSDEELNQQDLFLLSEARAATSMAYAPYSNFHVGAAARLVNGETVLGSNQENASFPAGICAERVLLSTASSLHSNIAIDTIAISYDNKKGTSLIPISPCGICRQSLAEYESRLQHPIRLILGGLKGKVYIMENVADLMPFAFNADAMK